MLIMVFQLVLLICLTLNLHHRAGVRLIIKVKDKTKGYESAALFSLCLCSKHLQLHQLYAFIAEESKISIDFLSVRL